MGCLRILFIIAAIGFRAEPSHPVDHRALWESHGINSYLMTIRTVAPPVIPIGLDLVVHNGEIISETIIACERPSEEYWENWCHLTRETYGWMGRTSIEALFENAEQCTVRTQEALKAYFPPVTTLCVVTYDPVYGYPDRIIYQTLGVHDGGSEISVTDFHPID